MNIVRVVFLVCFALVMVACSSTGKKGRVDQPYSAKELFVVGERAMADGEYKAAIEQFITINAQYPYGDYAQQAQMDIIYAYYQEADYAEASVAAGRYIHLYPRAKNVEYAYYMLGVANFEQQRSSITKYLPLDSSLRDIGTSMEAYNNFVTFVNYFPHSKYVADAKQRMIYLRNLFAQKELHIANYYYEHEAFVAAANRASYLVQTYPQAPQVEKALIIMAKANRHLGLKKPEEDALLVLKTNYPQTYEKLVA